MNVHHTLICFFFLSALQDGNTEVTKFLHYGFIGENLTVGNVFLSSGNWKIFCKEKCEGENILIKSTDVRAHRGRYSTDFKNQSTYYVLFVSITKLSQSDSGLYSCGLGGSLSSASYTAFKVIVAEALLDGNHDPSQQKHFYKETGSSLTVGCSFRHSGRKKLFCRGECGGDEVLIQTYDVRGQRGRYSIGSASGVLYVTITQLTQSDSGQYRCSLSRTFSSSFREFEITVTDASTPSPTAAQSFSSSSGGSTSSLALTGTTEQSEGTTSTGGFSGTQTPPSSQAAADVLLYVGLTPTLIILISVAVLIFCKKRSSKAKDPLVETEDTAVTETQDDSNHLTLAELSFCNRTFGFPNSASYSNTNDVISSVSRNVCYENCTPVSTCEDLHYQNLDPASRDLNQNYSTLALDSPEVTIFRSSVLSKR